MSLQVEVWSDFICPWCYLVSTSLEKLTQSHGVQVRWRAYELRPKGAAELPRDYAERVKAMKPRLDQLAKSLYGIEFNQGPLGLNSRPALIGLKFAQANEREAAYHKAVFHAYFREGQNIENTALLTTIAVRTGLDAQAFADALHNPLYDAQVDDDVEMANRREIHSVPALIFENRFYIPGAQPYDELVRFVQQMEQRLGKHP